MTEQEYNAMPGVRRSDLWKINDSPEKYKYALEHPTEPSPALTFGSAAHKFILEPGDWTSEYAIAPTVDKRTKAGKEVWELFCAENPDKTVISQEDFDTMSGMAEAIIHTPLALKLLGGKGQTEVPFFWKDKDTGEQCKVKLDRLVRLNKRFAVVDYKTAQCAQTDEFVRSMIRYGYHLQAAMYTEAVMKCKRLKYRPDFIFVVQEKKEPYSVNIVYVAADSGIMLYGVDTFRELLGTLHQCKLTDNWYGYCGPFGEMSEAYLPSWVPLGEEE